MSWNAIVKRLRAAGAHFKPVASAQRARLEAAGAPRSWLDLLREYGFMANTPFAMLSPTQALREQRAQRTFYRGASFGDEPEDAVNLAREQAFRATLLPFQRASPGSADFFCFAMANTWRGRPLIINVFHDDTSLVTGGDALTNPRRKTVYTRDLEEHLEWIARLLEEGTSSYPP